MAVGNKIITAPGVPERLASEGQARPALTFVHITALSTNLGTLVIGDSPAVQALPVANRKGTPLTAGQTWAGTVTDLFDIWIDATSAGDGLSYWSKAY